MSVVPPFLLASDETVFQFTPILVAIAWGAFGLVNFWVWRRSRSAGHLVMLIAAGWLAADSLLQMLSVSLLGTQSGVWATALGIALLTGGFYFTVQPLVASDLARLFGRKPLISAAPQAARFPSSPPRA